ncbi:MAG: glucuronate isomerase [Bacillota bacterium]
MTEVIEIKRLVEQAVEQAKITDIHTHLYASCFGSLFLYGVDELLTYHYLISEAFRWMDIPYEKFWFLSKREQADLVWKALFLDHAPISEVTRSLLTVFKELGLDVINRDLDYYRSYFAAQKLPAYIDTVFRITGLESLVMTNDPFDDTERSVWEQGYTEDKRFKAALRLDALLNTWDKAVVKLNSWGCRVKTDLSGSTVEEIRKFLRAWVEKMRALYCAVSLPPEFSMDDGSARAKLIEECVLPVCREYGIPFALMIGVRRQVNPGLRLAGDALGRTDLGSIRYLASSYPDLKFLVTLLSLENQHELIVMARKFRNIMPFGCWWFMNNPTIVKNLTAMRLEMLGASFIPQHSDCRVFEQLISKWMHFKKIFRELLTEKYLELAETGFIIGEAEIKRDVQDMLGGNFWRFIKQ